MCLVQQREEDRDTASLVACGWQPNHTAAWLCGMTIAQSRAEMAVGAAVTCPSNDASPMEILEPEESVGARLSEELMVVGPAVKQLGAGPIGGGHGSELHIWSPWDCS